MVAETNNYLNGVLNEVEFKSTYIATFCATYMANRYDDDCMNGHPNKPYNHQPIEDASFLANKAWEQVVKILG